MIILGNNFIYPLGCLVGEMFSHFWECCISGIDFELRFPQKYSHLTYGITTFPWDGIFFPVKRSIYSYYHPLPLAVARRLYRRTTVGSGPPPPNCRTPPGVFLEMCKILPKIQSVYQIL